MDALFWREEEGNGTEEDDSILAQWWEAGGWGVEREKRGAFFLL